MDAFPDEEDVPVYVRIPWTEMEVGESYLLVAPNWYVHQQYPESGGWYQVLSDRLSQSLSYVPRNALNIRSDAKGNLLGGTIAQTAETHDSSGYLPIMIGGRTYEDYMVVPPQDYMNYEFQSVNDDMWGLHEYAELTLEESNEQLDTCDFTGCFALKQSDGTYLAIDSATPWAGTRPGYTFASSSGYDSARNSWVNKSLTLGNGTYDQNNLKISSFGPWGDPSFRTVAYPDFNFYGTQPGDAAGLIGNTSADGADFMVFKFIEHPGDMCDVCGGTGKKFAYTDGGEGKIPVFTNRLKDGKLTIAKHIDPSSTAGYDPDQVFRFKVKLNGKEGETGSISYDVGTQKKPLVKVTYNAGEGHFDGGTEAINEVTYRLKEDLSTYEIISGEVKTPVMENGSFGGWYLDELLTDPFEAGSIPADDTTVYAKWEVTCETCDGVGYYWDGGEGDRTVWIEVTSDTVVNGNDPFSSLRVLRDNNGGDYIFDNQYGDPTTGTTGTFALVGTNGKYAWTNKAAEFGTVTAESRSFTTVTNLEEKETVFGTKFTENTFSFKTIPSDDPGYSRYGQGSSEGTVSITPIGMDLSHKYIIPGSPESGIEEIADGSKKKLIGTFDDKVSSNRQAFPGKDYINYATNTAYCASGQFQRCDQFYRGSAALGWVFYGEAYSSSSHKYYLVNNTLMPTSVTDSDDLPSQGSTKDPANNISETIVPMATFRVFRPATFHTCETCNGTGKH